MRRFLVMIFLVSACGVQVGNPVQPNPKPSMFDAKVLGEAVSIQLDELVATVETEIKVEDNGSNQLGLFFSAEDRCEDKGDNAAGEKQLSRNQKIKISRGRSPGRRTVSSEIDIIRNILWPESKKFSVVCQGGVDRVKYSKKNREIGSVFKRKHAIKRNGKKRADTENSESAVESMQSDYESSGTVEKIWTHTRSDRWDGILFIQDLLFDLQHSRTVLSAGKTYAMKPQLRSPKSSPVKAEVLYDEKTGKLKRHAVSGGTLQSDHEDGSRITTNLNDFTIELNEECEVTSADISGEVTQSGKTPLGFTVELVDSELTLITRLGQQVPLAIESCSQ